MIPHRAVRLRKKELWQPRIPVLHRCASQQFPRTDFQALDAKWQAKWAQIPRARLKDRRKCYVLPMFAYPSGSLHMGHLRVYTISDVLARYKHMQGYDVLHPTGWDAFGLPAENAAIERGLDPEAWTLANIQKMKAQLKSMNTDFDWGNELSTCLPNFYKHTQKLFLMLYKSGLAYQDEAMVNYDPVDKTVLANEQVDNNGRSWRSGALVEQKMLRQWFFKITAFQDALLDDLNTLADGNRWPERVIQQQRNWIGKSAGATIKFDIQLQGNANSSVNVFTTRPDTLFGICYIALSLSHPLVLELVRDLPELRSFISKKASFAPDSKEGFELPVHATLPTTLLGGQARSIPVFAAPYVLEGYGEGAVMGVPAHDTRDFGFWKLNKPGSAPLVVITRTPDDADATEKLEPDAAFTEHGFLNASCGPYAGMDSAAGGAKIVGDLARQGYAEEKQTWKLRDWLISRQRYWGTPIPIIHCESCGAVPVPDEDLPVLLPKLPASIQGQPGNPLDKIADFTEAACPKCGNSARRETDTMDTFVDSSWYYARFPDTQNDAELFSKAVAQRMLPVDIYCGGVEHAILHLLYARFIYKFLCQIGKVPSTESALSREPFARLIAQGMVHGKTYSDPESGRFLKPEEVEVLDNGSALIKATKIPAELTWEKMSKSKHNGVDPTTCMQKYGADVTRAHMLFAAPLSEVLQWDEDKIVGVQRWFSRISRLVDDLNTVHAEAEAEALTQQHDLTTVNDIEAEILLLADSTIRNVTNTFEANVYNVNTVVSDLIKMTNALFDCKVTELQPWVALHSVACLLKMLAPIAPAFVEQCYEDILALRGVHNVSATGIFDSGWPTMLLTESEKAILLSRKKTMTCAVQVNGKLRFTTQIPVPQKQDGRVLDLKAHESTVIEVVLGSEEGRIWLTEKNDWEKRKRVVLVKEGKVLNVVF